MELASQLQILAQRSYLAGWYNVWHCAILLDLMSGPGFTTAVNCVIVQEPIQEHIKNAPRSLSGSG
jgi:hypothetical protein